MTFTWTEQSRVERIRREIRGRGISSGFQGALAFAIGRDGFVSLAAALAATEYIPSGRGLGRMVPQPTATWDAGWRR